MAANIKIERILYLCSLQKIHGGQLFWPRAVVVFGSSNLKHMNSTLQINGFLKLYFK
jgi:hypothetical protein